MLEKSVVEQYLKEALLMQGQLLSLQEEKKQILEKVQKAKKWLAKQPDYLKFLQHLQDMLHQKNIGAFSELLSFFVKDVLQKDKEIVLDLYTYHNLPALRIEAQNPSVRDDKGRPFKENIYEGNGGSIANIVATGLRLIALSRLNHRKFIILDEPDCWLAPQHVPIFAKIIGEISEKLKIQTVIISHHHWSYFKDYGRVIELKNDGVHLTTEILHDTPVKDESDDVITDIILRRFMSHYETRYQLHPHLTCIVGENDIGKSVISAAMKAFAYGDSSDSYIMHNENEAQVMIQLTGKRQLLWQRVRETSQDFSHKVKFSSYIDGVPEGPGEYNSSETPKFISDILNILTTEDIDLHIGSQKEPVFLLSNQIKPQERAKILSLGKESLIIQKMMENVKSKTKEYKKDEKDGEIRYNEIDKQIKILSDIEDIVKMAENAQNEFGFLEKQQQTIEEIDNSLFQLSVLEPIAHTQEIAIDHIKTPVLYDSNALEQLIHDLHYHGDISQCDIIDYTAPQVELQDTSYLDNAIEQMMRIQSFSELEICDTQTPEVLLEDVQSLEHLIYQLTILKPIEHMSFCTTVLEPVNLHNTQEIDDAIHLLESAQEISHLTSIEFHIEPINLTDTKELDTLIQALEETHHLIYDLLQKEDNLNKWKVKLALETEETNTLLQQFICPTCKQPLKGLHLGENHA